MWKYAFFLSAILLPACSRESGPRTVEASGTVTLDGTHPAIATTDAQGRFSLKYNGEKKVAIPGNYQVQVSKTLLEASEGGGDQITISYGLPKQYSNIATSGLTQTIPDSGIKDIEIKLENK